MFKLKKLKSPYPHDMIAKIRGLGRPILNIIYKTLFPLKCALCLKEGSFLCRTCEKKLRYLTVSEQKDIDSPHVDRLLSCFSYEEPINSLIITGKYSFMPEVFTHLGRLATEHLKKQGIILNNFILCPIPLSRQRQRWRGFNQSQKLCETFSEALGLAQCEYLVRRRNTKTQKDLSKSDRQKNVKNCFVLNSISTKLIINQNILLVDDVATTGATLNAAAEVLMLAGAKTVWALTIARD